LSQIVVDVAYSAGGELVLSEGLPLSALQIVAYSGAGRAVAYSLKAVDRLSVFVLMNNQPPSWSHP